MEFVGDFERFVGDLYAYRWLLLAVGLAAFAAAGFYAYGRGWHLVARRHKALSAGVSLILLAVLVPAGWFLASPLFDRSFLEEASPLAEAVADNGFTPSGDSPDDGAAPERDGPPADGATDDAQIVSSGEWAGADSFHFGRGQALLIETAPGEFTLRVEGFSVRNGPDLFVYLSPSADGVDDAINLGELKATDGAFNHEIPPGTDVSGLTNALVWCRQFAVLFASAVLAAE